ncbi:MAG: hypothetical protein L0271_24690 [Gemmatimonadetes bacterium]|nr:hypothetical protein [Gemmatimonadota bacterium]
MADRIRVTLRWIQILDNLEPFYKERGEFRFSGAVSADGQPATVTRFPTEGYYEISDHPAWNKLNLDRLLFEGEVRNALTVELAGEELDTMSANDQLDKYKRSFAGPPSTWIGHYGPGAFDADVDPSDPENMSNWRVSYDIERI